MLTKNWANRLRLLTWGRRYMFLFLRLQAVFVVLPNNLFRLFYRKIQIGKMSFLTSAYLLLFFFFVFYSRLLSRHFWRFYFFFFWSGRHFLKIKKNWFLTVLLSKFHRKTNVTENLKFFHHGFMDRPPVDVQKPKNKNSSNEEKLKAIKVK